MKPLRLRRRLKQVALAALALGMLWLLLDYVPAQGPFGAVLGWALAAILLWACLVETRRLQLTRLDLELDDLPAALDGLRIVHLSDLHIGAFGLMKWDFRRVARMTQASAPDLIIITGDLVARNAFNQLTVAEALPLSAPLGVFAVLGNSDQKQPRKSRLRDEFSSAGVELLINTHRVIEREGKKILLIGVDDPVTGFADYDAAFRDAPRDTDLLIMLSHVAQLPAQLQEYTCQRLVLSGHTHGGQFRWPFAVRRPDTGCGCTRRDGVHVNVSRGVGYVFPMRIFCPPEVTLMTLKSKT